MPRISGDALERWARDLLGAAGLERPAAATVAASLIEASLRGVDSHGMALLPGYLARIRGGGINLRPRPRVVSEEGAVAVVSGDDGPGQVAGVFAAELSAGLAERHGVGVVSVRRSGHYGAAAHYVMLVARRGLVALSTTNAEPGVVPFGGREPELGTNPIAFAAPAGKRILVFDMATSQVAANRVWGAMDEGRPVAPDWAVDEAGEPTTDPAAVHAMAPLGGYKGYGLALVVEVLSAVLGGAGVASGVSPLFEADDVPQQLGHFHLALDPERTVGRARFEAVLGELVEHLRRSPPADGFDEVLVAGDPEHRAQRERETAGVPLQPALVEVLGDLSSELGVEPPSDV
jgi:LDH2 family malate/lactate/ureidoglycolate dehydrogenase